MSERAVAKLFLNGRSQAVRLPKEFRFRGDKVHVRRVKDGVLLEPVLEVKDWFARLDGFGDEALLEKGRRQPNTPSRDIFK
ncbi:MAG: AbrB/MazE/SpoVT family DNA-binding domain-containing protein [Chloroflexi bacterium]|nr:MAG: AbrB/MazE/SpoVT family DNA-binding domain-containing protein [Chloroflexota bacterium]TMD91615.1 MAG: AbrB/MazE/SpoVT family DNA-binding domain-containing protein [Chloroflexota bacterium]